MPEPERLEAVQFCMLLLDDESREALQCLLYFLSDIAQSSHTNKMDARNIAICLAPTLINMNSIKELNNTALAPSSSSATVNCSPLLGQNLYSKKCNASLDCLTMMIEHSKKIFQIPSEAYAKCQFNKNDYSLSLTLNELLGSYSNSMLNLYINDRIEEMLKETKDKPKNWTKLRNDSSVEIFFKNLEDDDHQLRLWKLSIEIDAPAKEILNKVLKFRSQWDDDLVDFRIVDTLNSQTDILQYVMHLMPPQPTRDFCELRCWKEATHVSGTNMNLKRISYFVYSTSIECEKASLVGDVRANTLRNFFLIETSSANQNKCTVYLLHRADYRGFSSEWYNKMQAHLLKRYLINLKECVGKIYTTNNKLSN